MSEKSEFAISILEEYAEQTGSLPRATTDLSPLEQWLIVRMYDDSETKQKLKREQQEKEIEYFKKQMNDIIVLIDKKFANNNEGKSSDI